MARVSMGEQASRSKAGSGGGKMEKRQLVTIALSCVAIVAAALMILWSQGLPPFRPKAPPPPPPLETTMTPEQKAEMEKAEKQGRELQIKRPPSGS